MIITVKKDTKAEDINEALKKLAKPAKKGLSSFHGKLKSTFGDGMAYQKAVRNEWD